MNARKTMNRIKCIVYTIQYILTQLSIWCPSECKYKPAEYTSARSKGSLLASCLVYQLAFVLLCAALNNDLHLNLENYQMRSTYHYVWVLQGHFHIVAINIPEC